MAQAKIDEENRIKEEAAALAQAKIDEENRIKEEAEALAQAKIDEENRIKTEAAALTQAKIDEENKVKEEAVALAQAKEELVSNPKDEIGKSMNLIAKETEDSKAQQEEFFILLNEAVINKNNDLKELKKENDLSEQGIYMEPKPFKSLTAENKAIEGLKVDLDNVIKTRNEKIDELEDLYAKRLKNIKDKNDATNKYYEEVIAKLKAEQSKAVRSKAELVSTLEEIKIATEFERKRRIKRAAFDNEEDRFTQDKSALNTIKQNTVLSPEPLKEEDFDFGEEQSDNIKILKNVKNTEDGYYLIIAVHSDVVKRDEFLRKAVASGERDINFFFDVNTSKYYIYYQKFDYINEANEALKSKGSKPYNGKSSIVKIEN